MFYPKIQDPTSRQVKIQTESEGFKKPFYFGGSQVPVALGISRDTMTGSGLPTARGRRVKGYNMSRKI